MRASVYITQGVATAWRCHFQPASTLALASLVRGLLAGAVAELQRYIGVPVPQDDGGGPGLEEKTCWTLIACGRDRHWRRAEKGLGRRCGFAIRFTRTGSAKWGGRINLTCYLAAINIIVCSHATGIHAERRHGRWALEFCSSSSFEKWHTTCHHKMCS